MTAKVSTAIRFDTDEKIWISNYAEMLGMSFSEFVRRCALERIEDDLDLIALNKAKAEDDGVRYTTSEVMAMIEKDDWYALEG